MATQENPILIDLDRGIIGRFQGQKDYSGDPGHVMVDYFPYNNIKRQLMGKPATYKEPVKVVNMFDVRPKQIDSEGVPPQIVFIHEGKENGVASFLNQTTLKRNRELEQQIEDLKLEVSTWKQRAENAQSGIKKVMSEEQELSQSRRRRTPPGYPRGLGGSEFDY